MLRQAPRIFCRYNAPILRTLQPRRLLNTAPPAQTSRTWKNSAARWTLAVGLIYWYNTSNLFAEEAAFPISQPLSPTEETSLPTVDDIARSRQKQQQEQERQQQQQRQSAQQASASSTAPPTSLPPTSSPTLSETEEEASQQGAFNEETGEINWDCPCLGGMAHGPCGEAFKSAFSCFVYSKEEPKGMDCIGNFQGMQECFKEHPDVYGDELEAQERDVEDELEERGGGGLQEGGEEREGGRREIGGVERVGLQEGEEIGKREMSRDRSIGEKGPPTSRGTGTKVEMKAVEGEGSSTQKAKAVKEQVKRDHGDPISESDTVVPKASHDAR